MLRYHCAMRRYLMIALILLTGLRGMVGDAMALEMANMHSGNAPVSAQAEAEHAASASEPPCHAKVKTSAETGADTGLVTDYSVTDCASCQVCHSPALQRLAATLGQVSPAADYASSAASNWVSADLAHLQKPPVS